jgi:hypothetical protein
MMPSILASIARKSSNKVPITIFQRLLAGDEPIKMKHFLMGLKGVFVGSDYGKSKCYGFRLWE